MLVKAGARQIMTQYADDGSPSGVAFTLAVAGGTRGFTLPVEIDRVWKVLKSDRGIQPRHKSPEQAQRVGWRIVKDWLEAQLAIVATEMVTFDQVMLPYMRTSSGQSVYDTYLEGGFPALSAPASSIEED
jgi:hypothetical protein